MSRDLLYAHLHKEDVCPRESIFIYVGSNERIFQKIGKYRFCYSFTSIEPAFEWMTKMQTKFSFECVFCDYVIWKGNVNMFSSLFTENTTISVIPFVICVNDYSAIQPDDILKSKFVDDVYCEKTNGVENLVTRLDFIKDLKAEKYINKILIKDIGYYKEINRKSYSLKRIIDITLSLIAISIIGPLLLVIALIIKLESKGPVFYVSKRVGTFYRVFNFYKFRTMEDKADSKVGNLLEANQYSGGDTSVFFKVKNDPRITRFGAILRKTSLDELPQLFNVLIGNMSIVGNRPLPVYEAAGLTRDRWVRRFMAPAGITGLWQVSKRGKKEMSVDERVALDILYAGKHSISLDLGIMLKTIPAMMQEENV